jgi:hypothetical protein
MKVKVFHANNPTFGMGDRDKQPEFPSEFTHVADVDVEIGFVSDDTTTIEGVLQDTWRLTNTIEQDWADNEEVTALTDNTRSSSVGDVFCLAGDNFRVAHCGFEKVPE